MSSEPLSSPAQRRSHAHSLAALLPQALWCGDAMGSYRASGKSSGYAVLDKELPGGGWPPSVLTELLWSQQGGGEFRLLAPVLQALSAARETIVLLAPPHRVFAPALAQSGMDIRQFLLVEPEKPADRLWAAEQVLKSASCAALLCWLPQVNADHLRRLQLAAGNSEGLVFVFRPVAAQRESSPAPLRLQCQAVQAGRIAVDIIKRRGPAASGPVLIEPAMPQVIARALRAQAARQTLASDLASATLPSEFSHAVDRALPAAIAPGSRVPSLA